MKLFNKILLSGVIVLSLLYSFLSLKSHLSLRIKKVQAQSFPMCVHSEASDKLDYYQNLGLINRDVQIDFYIQKNPSDQILERYIYYGEGSWQPIEPNGGPYPYDDYIRTYRQYSTAKDYTVGALWVYQNASGEKKTITCSTCTRIFDQREIKSFGTKRLIYPSVTTGTQVITGSRRYIGLLDGIYGGTWSGDNKGIAPPNPDGWKWRILEGTTSDRQGTGDIGQWSAAWYTVFRVFEFASYPKVLPSQLTFSLTAPTTVGNGAYSDYGFNNLLIYSRDLQQNPCGTCGRLPPIPSLTPTPTSTPTPTLTPPAFKKCTTVSGYVRNSERIEKLGIPGAKVRVWAMKDSSCTGSYSWCGTGDLTTNAQGYFTTSCSMPMSCLRVIEVQNAPGYKDSTKWPTVPAGSTVWSVNQVVWKNPPAGSCGTFTFYDIPSQ